MTREASGDFEDHLDREIVIPEEATHFPSLTTIPIAENSSPDSREFLNCIWAFISSAVVPSQLPKTKKSFNQKD